MEGGQRNDRKVVRLAGCEEKGWERCRASRRLDPLSHRPDRAASDPSAVAFACLHRFSCVCDSRLPQLSARLSSRSDARCSINFAGGVSRVHVHAHFFSAFFIQRLGQLVPRRSRLGRVQWSLERWYRSREPQCSGGLVAWWSRSGSSHILWKAVSSGGGQKAIKIHRRPEMRESQGRFIYTVTYRRSLVNGRFRASHETEVSWISLYFGSSCLVRRLIFLLLFTRPFAGHFSPIFSSRKAIIVFFLLLLLLLKEAVSFSKDTSRRKKLNGNKIESKIDIGGREFESNYNLTRWESFS